MCSSGLKKSVVTVNLAVSEVLGILEDSADLDVSRMYFNNMHAILSILAQPARLLPSFYLTQTQAYTRTLLEQVCGSVTCERQKVR